MSQHNKLFKQLLFASAAMFIFAFALVPLYTFLRRIASLSAPLGSILALILWHVSHIHSSLILLRVRHFRHSFVLCTHN